MINRKGKTGNSVESIIRQDRLVLRRRGYKQFEGVRFWLLTGLFSSPFFLFALAAWLPLNIGFIDKFVNAILEKESILIVLQFLIAPVAMVVMRFTMRETLILDNTGIIYFSGMPEQYQRIRLDWKYRWNDISAIAYQKQKIINPRLSIIAMNINKKVVRIIPWQWVDPEDPQNSHLLKNRLIVSNKEIYQLLEKTPVLKFFRERGLLDHQQNFKDPSDTLNSNTKAQIITGLFVVFVLYFVGDVFFGLTEYYVPDTPWHLFVLTGFLGIFIAYRLLNKEDLRKQESILMAVLFGLGAGLASYPLSIHANQWSDTKGLVSYAYELRERDRWYPLDGDVPVLTFDKRSRYWSQFNKGEQMNFELRHGAFGYIQINMVPIYADQERFYKKNIALKRKNFN